MIAFFLSLFLMNVMIIPEGSTTAEQQSPPAAEETVAETPVEEGAGKVLELTGEATAASSDNPEGRVLAEEDQIYLNETITTGADSSVQLELSDGSLFTISADTVIRIDTLTYDEASGDGNLAANVTKGIFRFVTGKIAVKKPENVNIEVPSGTIGIHGTIIEGEIKGEECLVSLGEETGGEAAKHRIIVSSNVEGKVEQVEITQPGFATMIPARGQMPKPAFQLPQADRARFQQKLPQPQFHQRGAEGRWQRDPNAPPPRTHNNEGKQPGDRQPGGDRQQNPAGGPPPPGGQGPNGPGPGGENPGGQGPGGGNSSPAGFQPPQQGQRPNDFRGPQQGQGQFPGMQPGMQQPGMQNGPQQGAPPQNFNQGNFQPRQNDRPGPGPGGPPQPPQGKPSGGGGGGPHRRR